MPKRCNIVYKQNPNIPCILNCKLCGNEPSLFMDLSWQNLVCFVCKTKGCENPERRVYVGNKHRAAVRWNRMQI